MSQALVLVTVMPRLVLLDIGLLNGLLVTGVVILLVLGRVLWPKETMQRWRAARRFRSSVGEMRAGLDKLDDERYDEALELFREAAAQTPNKPAPFLLRIYALGLQGQARQARQELRRALLRWPVETLPHRLLALAYLGAGEFDKAYRAGSAAIAEEPVTPMALRTMGDICRFLERYPEAERMYLNAVRQGPIARPSAGLAYVLAAQGRVEEAEEELALAPPRVMAQFEGQLALAYLHSQARRVDEAIMLYQALLTSHPPVPRVLVPYGLTLLEANRLDEAQYALDRAVSIGSDDPFAHCALAILQVERGETAEAVVNVREASRLWPGYGQARSVYGDVLKRAGKYESAEEQYREALRLNPFLAEAHQRLGALLRTRGALEEAREHEREAHRLRPSEPLVVTHEMIAVTTRAVANGTLPAPAPRPDVREDDPDDLHVVITPPSTTSKRLQGLRMRPDTSSVTPSASLASAARSTPSLMSDIVAYPGASLLFDESRESIFHQTLQVRQQPQDVLVFYRQRMLDDGWQPLDEGPSTVANIVGLTLHFQRDAQIAHVTIGLRPGAPPSDDRLTYIVTSVSHRH